MHQQAHTPNDVHPAIHSMTTDVITSDDQHSKMTHDVGGHEIATGIGEAASWGGVHVGGKAS